MNLEQMMDHALYLYTLYFSLKDDLSSRVSYDPEAHNLCLGVYEPGGGGTTMPQEFLSYSNPSSLSKTLKEGYKLVIGDVIGTPLINRGGMQDLHTEVRLVNHVNALGLLDKPGVFIFVSTRSVCDTCRSAIEWAQRAKASTCAFVPVSLHAEEFVGDIGGIDKVYPMMVRKGLAEAGVKFV